MENRNYETGTAVIDGIAVQTFKKEIVDANILEVEVGTTGIKGGDSGHGGRTCLRIGNQASTDMRVGIPGGLEIDVRDGESVELIFGGDTELLTFIGALEYAARSLRCQAGITEELIDKRY